MSEYVTEFINKQIVDWANEQPKFLSYLNWIFEGDPQTNYRFTDIDTVFEHTYFDSKDFSKGIVSPDGVRIDFVETHTTGTHDDEIYLVICVDREKFYKITTWYNSWDRPVWNNSEWKEVELKKKEVVIVTKSWEEVWTAKN